jgi:subtilase family serine protease
MAAAALIAPSVASAAPTASSIQPQDLGAAPAADTLEVSLILKLRNADALEAFVALSQEPGPTFHKFLSLRQFTDLFAPSSSDIATITRYLKGFGISVNEVFADRLVIHATGTVDAFNQAFSVDVHEFSKQGSRFRRPRHAPKIPLLLRDLLVAVTGFNTEPQFRPLHRFADARIPSSMIQPIAASPANGISTGTPGQFTPGDFGDLYDVNPLYDAAIDGTGTTIGIITLANFVPQDAYDFWATFGIDVDPERITQVHVDGGGLISPLNSLETSLDVEQSGGVAPGAKMVVYDSPNTDAGFIDMFYKAASDNLVDTLSISWGSPEAAQFEEVGGVDARPQLVAVHQAALELAAQGISMFAAAGDNGAFDLNAHFNVPFNNVLTVLTPASDPAITAAGGTTIPVGFSGGGIVPDFIIPTEQVWGWDKFEDFLVSLGIVNVHDLFPNGGGGGVSSIWGIPLYQLFTPGVRRTEPNQSVIQEQPPMSGTFVDLLDMPSRFAGRNLPDISANADPETGYLVLSTTDGGFNAVGGTSAVAPQLNGVSSLIVQAVGGRVGLWNPMLYRYKRAFGSSKASPIVDIAAGDNWFYSGTTGYDQGSGLGVLDVAKLATAIARETPRH